MTDDYNNGFIEEAKALLLQLEDDLMAIENNSSSHEIINNIFRVMHTLKGSAGMFGFKNVQDLTHEFENIYEHIREGKIEVNPGIIEVTLKGKDLLMSMLKENIDDSVKDQLINEIKTLAGKKPLNASHSISGSPHTYIVFFTPHQGIFERGLDPDKVLTDLKSSSSFKIIPHEGKKPWKKQKEEKTCQTSWEVYLRTTLSLSDLTEIFLFYDEDEFEIFETSEELEDLNPGVIKKLKCFYKAKGQVEHHIHEIFEELAPLAEQKKITKENTNDISVNQTAEYQKSESEATVNVSSHKLDELMNLVSELVTLTAAIQAHASSYNDIKLKNAAENIEKLTKKFRNNALDLRLVPVGILLAKFKRQVRDLSKELGKKVNLVIEGQDIEIDKSILRSIESPLQHIIRNSIDHGLELEDERISAGKNPDGLLKIMAFYSGASVILQVQDDGRGINLERVKECAIKKGLIQPGQNVSKQDLIGYIMEPGFTTSENISLVSGRGVGMDVVRKELNAVGGSLEVFTEKNLGTSIAMKLPTTLTIIDTLLVEIGDSLILVPVMDVEYCFKESSENLFRKDNRYIQYKNNPIPLVSLHEQFRYPPSKQKELMVIVINKFDRKYAITADKIIGEHQAVIKPLGDLFVNQPFFSGGSILVDGKMAFILDTNFLFNHITKL